MPRRAARPGQSSRVNRPLLSNCRPATHTSLTMSRPPAKTNCRTGSSGGWAAGAAQIDAAHIGPFPRFERADLAFETQHGCAAPGCGGERVPRAEAGFGGARASRMQREQLHFGPQVLIIAAGPAVAAHAQGARSHQGWPPGANRPARSRRNRRHSVAARQIRFQAQCDADAAALRDIDVRSARRMSCAPRSARVSAAPGPGDARAAAGHNCASDSSISFCDACSDIRMRGIELIGQRADAPCRWHRSTSRARAARTPVVMHGCPLYSSRRLNARVR